ncbi:hypothetical protein CTEN210_11185 [Chaetoceros tenuissimus]|uniref:N-acetyltransferase domain-containing protein n=1 Tax=Chaetoceros tenuissimus TaxID=426638 RepID=A0AAD3H9A9_9STRA|nr:hypothetical protein CTEN210_11185 [Chaetoceros tenuissimus]
MRDKGISIASSSIIREKGTVLGRLRRIRLLNSRKHYQCDEVDSSDQLGHSPTVNCSLDSELDYEQFEIKKFLDNDEEERCHTIRHEAWKVAYNHIYTPDEIETYFRGESTEGRTWTSLECNQKEVLFYEYDGEIVGYVKWAWNDCDLPYNEKDMTNKISSDVIKPSRFGEINSLYIHPNYWNKGIGSLLWKQIISLCHENEVKSLDIWVLQNARSAQFYIGKGCRYITKGDYFIGDHVETAQCYRWYAAL